MTRTKRSLSEIQSTATKAARGAGCPWGLAEEAGIAARVLSAHGIDGAAALSALFDTPRQCACSAVRGTAACGLLEMAALSDAPREGPIGPVAAPLLLLAPLLLEAQADNGWRIDWPSGGAECGPGGLARFGAPPDGSELTISRCTPSLAPTPAQWQSREVSDTAWSALEELAAKTYVPESDASRSAGAGPDAADTD